MPTVKNFTKFDENLILVNMKCNTKQEVLRTLGELLENKGYAKTGYTEALQQRENDFPTGIRTEIIGVAIPHTDSKYVNETTIAVGVLENNVQFEEMGSDGGNVEVEIVFVLAVKDPNLHLEFLQNLMSIFQKYYLLNHIKGLGDAHEIANLLNNELFDGNSINGKMGGV
ncbi:PTS sugar transporter subunit IIA [Fodinisporobacter ferrooxydans]|uniref:PTS sugar transporter subunit IIA n=1 Tax=Fodinisporobacter ferrooxydans TaxID=2901836 RepID=A0ABY4CIR0_9BACL|nr:PTS sugar transporter subunit IIA [Alicyclobacillaceae bacterium MYW30-H2]